MVKEHLLDSENLSLKPLTFKELIDINSNNIEAEALTDSIKIAISKKIEKMKKVSEDFHMWYTYWLIKEKSSGKGIGFIGFKGIPDDDGYVEVGYGMSPNYRRRGLMTEAVSLLTNWALEYPECKGVTATKVLKNNIGSNKVLKNCKFQLLDSSDEFNSYIKNDATLCYN